MPDARDLGPQLRQRLTYLLKNALLTLDELHEEHLAATGITVRELAVLLLLAGHEPASQQQAAERLGVDRTTMVALLDGLEGKDLVVRRPDPADRRRNVVELTGLGHDVLATATAASDRAEEALLASVDPGDAARLRAALERIALGG